MAFKIKDASGTLQTISGAKFKDGSVERSIVRMKVLDGATLRTVATFTSPLSATPSSAIVYTYSDTSSFMISDPVTCSPSGGLSPYTYAWTITSGTAGVGSPSSASSTFSKTVSGPGSTEYATAQCVVTDSAGSTATVTVNLVFEFVI